jgi:para-nitrobenzyl esterase
VADGVVLPDTPAALLARGQGSRVPLILGTNAREIPLLGGDTQSDRTVRRGYGGDAAAARAFYGLPGPAAAPDPRLGDRPLQIATDLTFRCPARSVARSRDAAGLASWHYLFDVAGPGDAPVTHGSEIRFVTGAGGPAAPLADYWLHFARTGDPNGGTLPRWPRYTRATMVSLRFDEAGPRLARAIRETPCRWVSAP